MESLGDMAPYIAPLPSDVPLRRGLELSIRAHGSSMHVMFVNFPRARISTSVTWPWLDLSVEPCNNARYSTSEYKQCIDFLGIIAPLGG